MDKRDPINADYLMLVGATCKFCGKNFKYRDWGDAYFATLQQDYTCYNCAKDFGHGEYPVTDLGSASLGQGLEDTTTPMVDSLFIRELKEGKYPVRNAREHEFGRS